MSEAISPTSSQIMRDFVRRSPPSQLPFERFWKVWPAQWPRHRWQVIKWWITFSGRELQLSHIVSMMVCVCACVRVCVGAWVRGCVGAWVGGCVHACMRAWVGVSPQMHFDFRVIPSKPPILPLDLVLPETGPIRSAHTFWKSLRWKASFFAQPVRGSLGFGAGVSNPGQQSQRLLEQKCFRVIPTLTHYCDMVLTYLFLAYTLTFYLTFFLACVSGISFDILFGIPAGNTVLRSLRWRSGGEHCDPELAVRVQRGTLQSRACSWGAAEDETGQLT